MPRITTCLSNGKPTTINQALTLRDDATNRSVSEPVFHCDECGQLVVAHKAGTTGAKAHFEHEIENAECPYFK